MSQMTSSLGVSQMPDFVASQKDYRKVKTRTRQLLLLVIYSMGRSIYRRSRKKLFYQSRIKSHLLYTIRQRILRAIKWYIIYKEIRRLSYLYGKHNYARSGSDVVNGLIDPELELYLRITDMLLQGFLLQRTRICTPFALKPHWLSSNQ